MTLSLKRGLCAVLLGHSWILTFGTGRLYLVCQDCGAESHGVVIEPKTKRVA